MEKQLFCKPYLGRFWLYRWYVGGVWRKYGYTLAGKELWGWYWTQDDLDYACRGQLRKLKEQKFFFVGKVKHFIKSRI